MQSPTTTQPTTSQPGRQRPGWLGPGLLWFAFDLLGPTALLYGLLWQGYSLYLALLASASVSAVTALISYWRGTARQRFAPIMLALALAGFGISLITGSDRFLLARESVLTSVVGAWFLASIWKERPLTYVFTRPLLEQRFGTHGRLWEPIWEREPRFRHIWRASTVMWAVALFIDAILRVVMAYTLPVNTVPISQMGLMIVTMLVMQVVTNVYYVRAGLWAIIWQSEPVSEGASRREQDAQRTSSLARMGR
ncbi:MAG TPA: VC0807 family protein [Thermomicrobiales bacterium]|nr:VC0807 family protein [Thermomicrobiales bacterium]